MDTNCKPFLYFSFENFSEPLVSMTGSQLAEEEGGGLPCPILKTEKCARFL